MAQKNYIVDSFQCINEFENYALINLPPNVCDYYRDGADEQCTLQNNKEAFKKWVHRNF